MMTNNYICITCGTQYTESNGPPERCPICEDERQYVGWAGQQWTLLTDLREKHRNVVEEDEPGLIGIVTDPPFAIGQRARLIQAPGGNVLWECTSLVDSETVEAINRLGGVSAIAISHPHFYSSMVEWSLAFGEVPIYLHADDHKWVMRPDPAIIFWEGEQHSLGEGLTLVRCGGHFPGSTLLHWADGAQGRGVLLTGDGIYVVSDRRYVSFMYSYPNAIPLSARALRRIVEAVEPFKFERLYSSWKDRVVLSDAHGVVRRSAGRYIEALES
ncbi:MAG: MBL fold metallo-hydrolase [Chloroflexota bacterium]|nr:MBL fold metallo-hydrolase [Chloroflexota bacterium]